MIKMILLILAFFLTGLYLIDECFQKSSKHLSKKEIKSVKSF